MPDNDLVAAPFADRHVATAFASITVTIAPIVIAIVITTLAVRSVSVTAVRSHAEVQLSKGDLPVIFQVGRANSRQCVYGGLGLDWHGTQLRL
jgi:hypothetical protein